MAAEQPKEVVSTTDESTTETGAKQAKGFFEPTPTVVCLREQSVESSRLQEDKDRKDNWRKWGPYLSERQWATVREDYSPNGSR